MADKLRIQDYEMVMTGTWPERRWKACSKPDMDVQCCPSALSTAKRTKQTKCRKTEYCSPWVVWWSPSCPPALPAWLSWIPCCSSARSETHTGIAFTTIHAIAWRSPQFQGGFHAHNCFPSDVAFSSCERIWGECLTIHSPLALFISFLKWRLAYAH